jgi:8-oxo-dGTP diphosphatase
MSAPPRAKRVRVAAAIVRRGRDVLMTRRPPGGPLGLQWEFPGGKIESAEAPAEALVREIAEELGVAAIAHETIAVESYTYPHGLEVELHFIRCTLASHEFTPDASVHAVRWSDPAAVDPADVLAADRQFLARLAVTV